MYNELIMRNFSMTDKLGKLSKSPTRRVPKAAPKKKTPPARQSTYKLKKGEEMDHDKNTHYTVEISWKSILLVLGTLAAIYLGYRLLVLAGILLFAFALASAVLPIVRNLSEKGLGKGLSIFIVYFTSILTLVLLGLVVFVPLQSQAGNAGETLNTGFSKMIDGVAVLVAPAFGDLPQEEVSESIRTFLTEDLSESFNLVGSNFDGALTAVTTLASFVGYFALSVVLSVWIVFDHDNFLDIVLLQFTDDRRRGLVRDLVQSIESQLGDWLRGQGTLSLTIGIMIWIMLTIFGVPYALPFALLAAILEMIPTIGPMLASIPAIATALFTQGPGFALMVLAGYLVVQWLEGTFIVPRVMGNATGLRPIVVILGVFTGFTLFGPVGTLLAIPTLVVIKILYSFYIELQRIRAEESL